MDDLDIRLQQAERRVARADINLSRLAGRVEAAYDRLADDPAHRELLRAGAWLRHDPSLGVTYDGRAVRGLPEGWPESVPDPDGHVVADIAARRDAHLERLLGRREEAAPEPEVTPSVGRFRQMIGDVT